MTRNFFCLLTSKLFFELCISQGYIENFGRYWRNSFCIRVNNFAKSANFKISRESSQRKKFKLSKFEYSYVGKLTFV